MKVPVQKGELNPSKPTSKFMSRAEKTSRDMEMHDLRKSGQTLHYKGPKK